MLLYLILHGCPCFSALSTHTTVYFIEMVFKYTRKTTPIDPAVMSECLSAVEGGMPVNAAANAYRVPETTLRRYWKAILSDAQIQSHGGKPSLPPDVEIELATVVKVAAANGFGYSMDEIKEFVGEFVRKKWDDEDDVACYLRENCRFNREHRIPGKDWMKGFMRTHNLSLQKPGALEKTRKTAESNPFLIYPFYDILEREVAALGLENRSECIWNLDESPFWIDPNGGKVVGATGVKSQRVVSGPGRSCVSVMGCVSASGIAVPPLFIFEGKHLYSSWKGTSPDIPPGTTYAVSGKL